MKLLAAMSLFLFGQTLIWFQTNGQFIKNWAKEHPAIMAALFCFPISYSFLYGTKFIVEHFDGILWPGILIGFGIGTITFGILTWLLTHEVPTIKTFICLLLALAIILIQISNVADV